MTSFRGYASISNSSLLKSMNGLVFGSSRPVVGFAAVDMVVTVVVVICCGMTGMFFATEVDFFVSNPGTQICTFKTWPSLSSSIDGVIFSLAIPSPEITIP